MTKIYKNNFKFVAVRYEEWQAGRCISRGPIDTVITAEVSGNSIYFELDGVGDLRILQSFDFNCGNADVAILGDRIQYSHATSDYNPIVPIVCHVFFRENVIEYVRFAMTNPDRLIEFYGKMVELGQPSTRKRSTPIRNKPATADEIIAELEGYGMLNVDALMERAVDMYNDNAQINSLENAEAVAESLKLFVEVCNLEREQMKNKNKEYSMLMPKILMFIALCNYKIGNVNSAYYIAKKALNEIDIVEENSVISGIPREVYGEPTIKELIDIIEDENWDEIDEDMDVFDIDETEIDLDNLYNLQHKMNREAKAKVNPEAQRILQLVEVVDKVQAQFWEAGGRLGNTEKRFQFHSLFNLIKNALYYSWEKLGCGHHGDFWKEGDSMFDYMMFEMGPEERIDAIVQMLDTSSPFAMVERNSAITNGLLSVFRKVQKLKGL